MSPAPANHMPHSGGIVAAIACLLLAACNGSGKNHPKPTQLWSDGLYTVSVGGSTAHFAISGPAVAVNGVDVPTRMERYFTRGEPSRWQQVGTHGSVMFALRSGRQVRLTHDGRSVVVTAQRVSSNG